MKTQKLLLIGCGLCAVLGAIGLALLIGGFVYLSQDPEGLSVTLQQPAVVERGREFTLTVSVVNERERKSLKIDNIDLSEDYLKGFTVISYDPPCQSSYVSLGTRTFEYDATIGPGESNLFTFTLKPLRKGRYTGDVDVYEGWLFLTQVADTVVE